MNERWVQADTISESFHSLHGIKPQVDRFRVSGKEHKSRLKFKKNEVILTEILENGLTKEAILECDGVRLSFKRVIDAEKAAVEFLKKEKKDGDIK